MFLIRFIQFLLKFLLPEPRVSSLRPRQQRTRSDASPHVALGDAPFHIGAQVVSPGAPLSPPNRPDPASLPPTPPDLDGLPPDVAEVDLRASADSLYNRAHDLQHRRAFQLALPWWKELSNRKEARRFQADAWYMRCLLDLGDFDQARFLYEAPDATRDTLQVAGQYLVEHGDWEAALAIWRRLHTGVEEQKAEATFYITTCLLQLDRVAEAEAFYIGRTATVDALKAACDYYHQRSEYDKSLPMWNKLKKLSRKFGGVARAGIVDCHLQLNQADEACALYANEHAVVPVLRAAAMYFYRHNDFAAAMPLFRRIAEYSDDEDEAITAEEYTARCLATNT